MNGGRTFLPSMLSPLPLRAYLFSAVTRTAACTAVLSYVALC